MTKRNRLAAFIDSPLGETILFVIGVLLVIAGIIISPVPGPGGVFLIAPGLALILKTSMWAKRNYVRFKRWQPKAGRIADRAMRRPTRRRRDGIRKREQLDQQGLGD